VEGGGRPRRGRQLKELLACERTLQLLDERRPVLSRQLGGNQSPTFPRAERSASDRSATIEDAIGLQQIPRIETRFDDAEAAPPVGPAKRCFAIVDGDQVGQEWTARDQDGNARRGDSRDAEDD